MASKTAKMAQDGLQDASKVAKMASKTAKMAPRCTQDASNAPKRPPRLPKRPQRGPPGRPEEVKTIDFPKVFEGFGGLRFFGLPVAQDGSRGHQDRPKIAQEASKRAP